MLNLFRFGKFHFHFVVNHLNFVLPIMDDDVFRRIFDRFTHVFTIVGGGSALLVNAGGGF